MELRVYLILNNGKTDFIDYGLQGKNYRGILRTEIREDSSKVKTYSGSKYVGIPEIDDPVLDTSITKIKKKSKKHTTEYEIFNYKVHDTDRDYYWVSALCTNCLESCQVAIPRGEKIDKVALKKLACPKCGLKKSLNQAKWNGHEHVKV